MLCKSVSLRQLLTGASSLLALWEQSEPGDACTPFNGDCCSTVVGGGIANSEDASFLLNQKCSPGSSGTGACASLAQGVLSYLESHSSLQNDDDINP